MSFEVDLNRFGIGAFGIATVVEIQLRYLANMATEKGAKFIESVIELLHSVSKEKHSMDFDKGEGYCTL